MKNSNKAKYTIDDANLNLIDCETNVKNFPNLLFQEKTIPVINKSTTVSCNNTTVIDHINTNHFLNNNLHSGILDQFLIFLTSKDFMLDFSNEPIHTAKREMYKKSILKLVCLLLTGNMC